MNSERTTHTPLTGIFTIVLLLLVSAVASAQTPVGSRESRTAGKLPAFPGAEGFGAETPGGRGGKVIEVNNLNDSGQGSFRAACEAAGPRIIVFRTGGTIMLKSGIEITNPCITIAGQSACGGGICLRNDPVNRFTAITVSTHDVVIRYLRIRPGASTEKTGYLNSLKYMADKNE